MNVHEKEAISRFKGTNMCDFLSGGIQLKSHLNYVRSYIIYKNFNKRMEV